MYLRNLFVHRHTKNISLDIKTLKIKTFPQDILTNPQEQN